MFDRLNPGSNENPGPGTYAAEKVKLVTSVKDMMNNSFMTKVSLKLSNNDLIRFQDFAQQLQVQACLKSPLMFKTLVQELTLRVLSLLVIQIEWMLVEIYTMQTNIKSFLTFLKLSLPQSQPKKFLPNLIQL